MDEFVSTQRSPSWITAGRWYYSIELLEILTGHLPIGYNAEPSLLNVVTPSTGSLYSTTMLHPHRLSQTERERFDKRAWEHLSFPLNWKKQIQTPRTAHKSQRRDAHLCNGVPSNATYLCFYIRLLSPSSLGNFCWCRCHRIRKSLICWLGCEVYNRKANKGEETFWHFDPEIKEHGITLDFQISWKIPCFWFLVSQEIKEVQGREFPSGGCWGLKVTVSCTVTQWKSEAFCDCLTHMDTLKQNAYLFVASPVTEGPNHLANVEQGGDWSLCIDHLEDSSFPWRFIHNELQGELRKTGVLSIYLWANEISISHFPPLCILF